MMIPLLLKYRLFLVLTSLTILSICAVEARSWTNTKGVTIQADFVKSDGETVTIRLGNDKEHTIPINSLSQKDQDFITKQADADDEGDAPKPDAKKFNWTDPWPQTVAVKDTKISVELEDAENKKFIYTSNNFRFNCDVRLTSTVVSTFAKMFEASHEFCRVIPLALTGGMKNNGKYDIRLFETKASYIAAGGPPTSAGVFMGGRGRGYIMVPLASLGVQKFGSGYRRDRDKDDSTLVHEIVHQLSPSAYFQKGSSGWFSEGIAEYISNTPYRSGRFKVANNFDEIVAYFSAFGKDNTGGRNLGEEFTVPALKEFMTMPYSEFTANGNFNYGVGLVLTTYFLHLEGEGDAALIKEFLKKLHEKGRIKSDEDRKEILDILLNGRTWEELETDVRKAWRKKGIKITFSEASYQ